MDHLTLSCTYTFSSLAFSTLTTCMKETNQPFLHVSLEHINIETLLTHRLILKSTRSPTRLVLLLVRLSRQCCCASWDADDIDREFFTLLVSWLTLSFLWEIMNLFILRFSHGLMLLMFYVTFIFPWATFRLFLTTLLCIGKCGLKENR